MFGLKKAVHLLAVLAVLLAFTSCQPKEVVVEKVVEKYIEKPTPVYTYDEQVTAKERYQIALVVKMWGDFWLLIKQEAERAAKDAGVDITSLAPAKAQNLEEQTRIVEDLIEKGVDGVIIAPVSTSGIAAAIQKLNAANIPVVYANTIGSGGDYVSYIGADNILVGQTCAKALVDMMGTKGNVLILEGFPGQQTADDRRKGMNDYLAQYPDIKVISQTTHWSITEAAEIAESVLQRWDKIDGILGASAALSLAAADVLKQRGVSMDSVVVGGVDVYKEAVAAVEDGTLDFTVSQGPRQQGYWSVVALVKHLNGESVPLEIRTPMVICTKDNVQQYAEWVD